MDEHQEGAATITAPAAETVTRDLPVFYNPIMKHNRDVTLLLLAAEGRALQCCDLLAGSGVRSIRLLLETPGVVKHVTVNDASPTAHEHLVKNLAKNGIAHEDWTLNDFLGHSHKQDGPGSQEDEPLPRVTTANLDGNQLLLASNGYDYIDIDPFGSPNGFLDTACRRIARNGILAVTATDTSALAASYPAACRRKYWAEPAKGRRKHEAGLRILARKVQLIGAQHEKALEPILGYTKDHYYRIFFRVRKGRGRADKILARHGRWGDEPRAGPLWLGRLSDPELIGRMISALDEWTGPAPGKGAERLKEWLLTLKQEAELEQPAHYYFLNDLKERLRKEDLLALPGTAPVHYEGNAVKSTLSEDELIRAAKRRRQSRTQ